MVKYVGGEIKFAIDHWGLDQIVKASKKTTVEVASGSFAGVGTAANGGAARSWSGALGTASGEPWIWRKYEFLNTIEQCSNDIWTKTLRANGSYILCGIDVARVIKQLAPNFTGSTGMDKKPATGPYVLGKLDGRTVIVDPFMVAGDFTMGWKGSNVLDAGFVYAPYIPLFTTPTLVTSDLRSQKGFLSSQGFKVINNGMFANGNVTAIATH